MADEIEEGGDPVSPLPSSRDDEFRPFVRRLPEWQFWCVVVQLCMFILKYLHRGCSLQALGHPGDYHRHFLYII